MKNKYHIEVKECCASCQRRNIDEEGERLCQLFELKVESGFKCRQWQISDGINNAGKSGGVVRLKGDPDTIVLR